MPAVQHPTLMSKAAAGDRHAFETALASLGRSTISSLAPAISRYEIGFQVLDQDDDNYCAVGVFGYKLGKRLMYIPMFYRDGVIKGVEQLRDPKRNMSVPLSDNWVNKFLSDSGDEPSKLINKSKTRDTAQPSLWQLKYPPTKYSSDQWGEAVQTIRKDLAVPMVRAGGWPEAPDLLKVASEHPEIMGEVGHLITSYPWFAKAVDKFYGFKKLAEAVSAAEKVAAERKAIQPLVRTKKASAPKKAGVTVIRVSSIRMGDLDGPSGGIMGFSPGERAELKAGRNAYRDDRGAGDITAVESAWDGSPGGGTALENPGHSGVYQVLGEDMKLHECAVFFPLISWTEVAGLCLVVRTSDKAFATVSRTAVWVASATPNVRGAEKWYDELPKAENLPKDVSVSVVYLMQGGHLVGSTPFRTDDSGHVWDSCGYAENEPYWTRPGYKLEHDPGREPWSGKRVRVSETAVRLTTQSGVLYAPATAKYVKLDGDRFRPAYGDDPDRYLIPAIKAASEKSDVIRVHKTRTGFVIDVTKDHFGPQTKSATDTAADLVEKYGLRPPDAESLVSLASGTGKATAIVKYAGPYGPPYLENDYPNAPTVDDPQLNVPSSFADDVVPSESGTSLAITVPDLMPEPGSADRYQPYPTDYGVRVPLGGVGNAGSAGEDKHGPHDYDSEDVKSMSSAAGGGIKELFDTAALSAIVKRKGVARIIDKLVRASVKTMNDAADALCHLYWNPDDWAERFGEAEVGPIEDQLADQFKGIGELHLTLQEKQVDGARDFGMLPGIDTIDAATSAGK